MLNKYLCEYVQWHKENARFYEGFDSDVSKLRMLQVEKWALTFGAAAFAAVFINPNFTNRRSYYARKLIPAGCALVAY